MALLDPITVRIPELVGATDPLSLSDKLPIWIASINKTRNTTLTDLRTLIMTGGPGSHPPVYNGGSIVYIVPNDIAPGSQVVSIPSLAGKDFILRREGRVLIPQEDPAILSAEYDVLDGGGFQLLIDEDYLIGGERFELDVFSLQGGAPAPGASTGSSLITGVVPITVNTTLNPTDHLNKLIQLRAGSSQVTLTLFDLDDIPANTIICIEATILNTFQNKVQTQGGQYIYLRNQSVTYLYMAKGEVLWLYRGEDGFYELNNWSSLFDHIGKPVAAYKVGFNEVLADGTALSRTLHPRLYEYALTLGSSMVSDGTWGTGSATVAGRTVYRPYRGCYSTGDNSTTFRLPDLMDMALRGVKTIGGSDSERYFNGPGGYQRHEQEQHDHALPVEIGGSGDRQSLVATPNNDEGLSNTDRTGVSGGLETRMDNIGILWVIKE